MAEGAGLAGAASGAGLGAKIGGIAGSVVPGVGNVVGTAAGAVIGAGAGAARALGKQKKSEDSQNIALVDQNERRRLAELNQISKNISSGTDALTQNKLGEVGKLNAQTQNAVSKISGGDVGATRAGLLAAQRNAQAGTNTALTDRGQLPYYQGLAGSLSTGIAQRKLELGLLKRGQQTAEYAQQRKDDNLNMMGALGTQRGGAGAVGQSIQGLMNSPYQMDKLKSSVGFDAPEIGMATPIGAGNILPNAPTMNSLQTGPAIIPGTLDATIPNINI